MQKSLLLLALLALSLVAFVSASMQLPRVSSANHQASVIPANAVHSLTMGTKAQGGMHGLEPALDHEDYETLASEAEYHTALIESMERSRASSPYLHELVEKHEAESPESGDAMMRRVEGEESAAEIRRKLEPYLHPKPQKHLQHEPAAPFVSQSKQRQLRSQHMKHVMEMKYKKLHAHQRAQAAVESLLGKVTSVANHTVAKSTEDDRAYRFITLQNGLRAVLVSDPNTTKAAAAMDVGNGYLSDPVNIPGLAHFLEHMLFLGTEKFPSESAYADFIESHGGFSNAYTAMENTNYYFDILPNHLTGALDRFSQFFISPLLNVNSTGREMKAVDSEHSKNILSDNWRANRLLQDIANRTHPYAKFGTGCARTLDVMPHSEMQGHLREFWSKHYTAGNLFLSVIGQESLDQLQEMVDERFSDIKPSENIYNPLANTTYQNVFNSSILGSEVFVNTIEDTKFLSLIFPIESQYPTYKHQALSYIRTLVEGRGANSLLKQLKQKGWATAIQLGIDAGTSAFATIQFSVDLTNAGATHIDEIIAAFFSTLHTISKHGIDQWRFDEMAVISNLTFTYKDKEHPSDYISKLASNLRHYPPEDVLIGGKIFLQFSKDAIARVIQALNPENMILVIGGKDLNHEMKFTEKWYGIEYDVVKIDAKRVKYWKHSVKHTKKTWKFSLPIKSAFIPRNLTVNPPLLNPVPRPIVLFETLKNVTDGSKRLWYSEDLEFHRPHGHAVFRMYVPSVYSSARNYLLTNIFVNLLEDQVDEDLYSALVAGFNAHFRVGTCYLDLIFYGYNQGLVNYGQRIAQIMNPATGFRPDPSRFAVYKETLLNSYLNKKYEAPHRQSSKLLNSLLDPKLISNYDLVRTLENISFEDVKAWPSVLYNDMSVEAYVHGNVPPAIAKKLLKIFTKNLPFKTTSAAFNNVPTRNHYIPRPRLGQVKEDVAVTMFASNPQETNSAIVKYWQFGMGGIEGKLYSQLLALIGQKPIFHQLRTTEQLGYIVWSSADERLAVNGFKVQVQSGRRPAHYLSGRIDAFMKTFQQRLLKMDQKQFETYIETLMMSKLQSPVSMAVQTSWFWNEISKQEYIFQRKEIELYILNATKVINRAGFQSFVQKLFYISDPDNPGVESCEVRGGGVLSVRVESPVKQVPIVNNSTKKATGEARAKKHKAAKLSGGASIVKKKKVSTRPTSNAKAKKLASKAAAGKVAKEQATTPQQTSHKAFTELSAELQHDSELADAIEAETDAGEASEDAFQAELDHDQEMEDAEEARMDAEDFAADGVVSFLEIESELEHNPHAEAATTHTEVHDHAHTPQQVGEHYELPHAASPLEHHEHGHAHGENHAHAVNKKKSRVFIKGAGPFATVGKPGKSVSVDSLDQPVVVVTRAREGGLYVLNTTQSAIHVYTDSLMLYPRNRYEQPPPVTNWVNVKPEKTEDDEEEETADEKEEKAAKKAKKSKKNSKKKGSKKSKKNGKKQKKNKSKSKKAAAAAAPAK